MDLDLDYRPTGGVRHRVVADQAVIVQQETGEVMGLDETGTEVFAALVEGLTPRQAARRLAARYGVDEGRALGDVARFVGELCAAGVLSADRGEG